jgi:hypothetical protein
MLSMSSAHLWNGHVRPDRVAEQGVAAATGRTEPSAKRLVVACNIVVNELRSCRVVAHDDEDRIDSDLVLRQSLCVSS